MLFHDEEKIINIYEKTGLGIISNNGKPYIEIGEFTSLYNVPLGRLPYFYLVDHKTFIDSNTHQLSQNFQKTGFLIQLLLHKIIL